MRLSYLGVEGLLGRFTHELDFPPDWEFLILHGPNGVGKTKLLELIDAVGAGRFHSLFRIPFTTAVFTFDNGSGLSIVRTGQLAFPTLASEAEAERPRLDMKLTLANGDAHDMQLSREDTVASEARLSRLERQLPVERIDRDTWLDYQAEEYLTTAELLRRYPVSLTGGPAGPAEELDPAFRDFVEAFNVHLIETQRLISVSSLARAAPTRKRPPERRTVLAYAEDLTRRLREALAENSRTSQELDRSFPRRVLDRALVGRHYSCHISGGGSVVLVDEAAEPVATADLAHG